MRKILLTTTAFLFASAFSMNAIAQQRVVCATDEYHQHYVKENPALKLIENQMNKSIDRDASRADDTATIIIPVVFHVIHVNGPENINKKILTDQLITLNEVYQKRNKDTVGVDPAVRKLIGNARIEFRLATQDPWGRCTDGIDRVYSAATDNASNNVKALAWWDSRLYLNIWVCKSLDQSGVPNGVLAGYAQFPWDLATRPSTDGIVMDYKFLGKGKKTLVHEIGHWLGLYHTFQDGCLEDATLEGDHVSDTPPVLEANFGCPSNLNSCHNDSPDLPDMIHNFMDYTDCSHMFTQKQTTRMRWFLKGARSKMVSQENYNYVFANCSMASINDDDNAVMDVQVYPNPSNGDITVSLGNVDNGQVAIEVYDIAGKRLSGLTATVANGKVSLTRADMKIMAAGVYNLKISTSQSTGFVKVMIVQ
jgi:hypothetical protein